MTIVVAQDFSPAHGGATVMRPDGDGLEVLLRSPHPVVVVDLDRLNDITPRQGHAGGIAIVLRREEEPDCGGPVVQSCRRKFISGSEKQLGIGRTLHVESGPAAHKNIADCRLQIDDCRLNFED